MTLLFNGACLRTIRQRLLENKTLGRSNMLENKTRWSIKVRCLMLLGSVESYARPFSPVNAISDVEFDNPGSAD